MKEKNQMSAEQCIEFERELATLLNRMSLERFSNTPDFIIAKHLCWALLDFNATMFSRDKYGKTP